MNPLPLIFAVLVSAFTRKPRPRPAPLVTEPGWAATTPPYVLPTAPLPQRCPGMALIRERVGLQMAGFLPHTSHRAPEDLPRVRPGWVALDVTAEFNRITGLVTV